MESTHDDARKPHKDRRAEGGRARAAALTPAERADSARNAAHARWSKDVARVLAGDDTKPLIIGDTAIECYVLEGEVRVITQASFLRALGRGKMRGVARQDNQDLPPFLASLSLRDYLTPEILAEAEPIMFTMPTGQRAKGYRATLLPKVCNLYLKANDNGAGLPSNQKHIAIQADILIRGLAEVGILALVDEVTGYQEVRTKDALAKILEAFVDKELRDWVRTFPDDYYKELFRLRGLDYPSGTVRRPQYFGMLTNDIVYRRLAPGVLDELKRVQRVGSTGKPKDKLFQRLTANKGYPKLREHLGSVVMMMKMSPNWDAFKRNLDTFHPKYGDTMPIDFDGAGL